MDATAVIGMSMRWLHIFSVVILVGAFFYTWSTRRVIASSFRMALYLALLGILASGTYNYLTKASYPPHYHMWIGIKFLLVLHVFAVTVLANLGVPDPAKFQRRAMGVVISAAVII